MTKILFICHGKTNFTPSKTFQSVIYEFIS